jgi:hypothetical protein
MASDHSDAATVAATLTCGSCEGFDAVDKTPIGYTGECTNPASYHCGKWTCSWLDACPHAHELKK